MGVHDVDEHEFKQRTKTFALRVIRLAEALPRKVSTDVMSKQLIRCATSVGANYRSACRAKSTADLIAKLSIVEEEADECLYWLELLVEADAIAEAKVKSLMTEVNEIIAMTVASIKTLRRKQSNLKSKIPTDCCFHQNLTAQAVQSKIQNLKSKIPLGSLEMPILPCGEALK